MRVIAGTQRGRRLFSPRWAGLRPTSDRLRETLFDVVGARVEGARVLDGCAGTGAVGIEALSRGAIVELNEPDRRRLRQIRSLLYEWRVGVAGLHRLLAERSRLEQARVIVVIAGMEGALPSVVGGLVSVPGIAVPTSIGYGASFGGVAALLGMLNSCGSGVTVVNIDNGFGAGFAANQINALASD